MFLSNKSLSFFISVSVSPVFLWENLVSKISAMRFSKVYVNLKVLQCNVLVLYVFFYLLEEINILMDIL